MRGVRRKPEMGFEVTRDEATVATRKAAYVPLIYKSDVSTPTSPSKQQLIY